MEKPISVVMSVYNEKGRYLTKSIESILSQSFLDFEFIIINDGTTDESCLQILNKYARKDSRIKMIANEKNLGLTKSLNAGLKTSKGKYIARIDSDDIAETERLEKQLAFMEKNPEIALCGTWSYIIDENCKIIGEKKFFTDYDKIKKNLLYFNFFTHSSLFFNRETILKENCYNESMHKAQDYDLILKISAKYPIANMPEFLCRNRIHQNSISVKLKSRQELNALMARFRAIFLYGYPKTYIFKIIPSAFYLCMPYFIKKQLLKIIQNNV